MRLALDIDNVVLEWQYHWPELYRQWYGGPILGPELDSWNACLDHTKFENMDQFYAWYAVADGWDAQPYVPGAAGFLWDLKESRHSVVFVTSRPWDGEQSANNLGRRWTAPVEFRNNTSKHLAKADLWVDDSPEVLTSLVENGKRAVRFDRPWNRKLPKKIESKLLVARDWNEVSAHVEAVSKELGL